MYIYLGVVLFLLLLYLLFSSKAKKKYGGFVKEYEKDFQLTFMAPMALLIIEKIKFMERFPHQVTQLHQKIIRLYGNRQALDFTRMTLAQLASFSLVIFFMFTLLAAVNEGDHVLFGFGLFFACIVPPLMIKRIGDQIKKREEEIVLSLPEFVNKVTLLVNAGETVQKAMVHCVEQNKDEKNALYVELKDTVIRIRNNEPFTQALEQFSKNCAIQEVSVFTTTVLLNYRRGGSDFVVALRELARELWEKRKNIARQRGEQASSKLVFPMIFIFVAILVIVAYPALSIM
ncbi:type II secretion system F family protein [Aureibacillus halotolerans]|uniref:Type II secretion system protein F (GspF) n=1 Tax=Aureibacillus halotolerans TaxID=1508390 RepID=A0A4R6U8R2_9BACI|nr:type II secretion system F family protein [Aureibacillus halotolerans]TDQ42196.1 type II secretion system protein F (GspF) [Aureibacillus halotolerans]